MSNPTATLETSLGTITVELFTDKMPSARTSDRGAWAELVGWPPHGAGDGPDGPIKDEHPANAKLSNEPGTLSMANSGDANTGSCQFFVNTVHNSYLDWFTPGASKHPVFGKVISGMDVVTKIEKTPTDGGDRPRTPVKMIRVTVKEA